MEHDDIEFIGFHEEVDDINEKFHYLDDSYLRFDKIFEETIKNKKFRSELDLEVRSMIDVANDIKLIIESILVPHSTSIPCLTDLRRKLIRLVYRFNGIRRGSKQWYESRVVQRLKCFWREITTCKINAPNKKKKKNLSSIEMFLSMMKDLSIEHVVYEEDFELIETMQKVVKERHEEMIKIDERMIELEQLLFQMYAMVQEKLVILVNEEQAGNDDDGGDQNKEIYVSVQNLYREARHKREDARIRRDFVRLGLSAFLLWTFMFGTINVMYCSGLGWFKGRITASYCSDKSRFMDWFYFELAYILMCVMLILMEKSAKARWEEAEMGLLD